MNQTKRLLLFLCILSCCTGLFAQDATQRLVVWQKSGEKVYFDLSDEPRTSFKDGLLIINTKDGVLETSFQLSQILRYTHEGIKTGISEVKSNDLIVSQSNDAITLKNVAAGTILRLYDPTGTLLETQTSDGTSPILFSLSGRPTGIYLVNVNDRTYKLSKR